MQRLKQTAQVILVLLTLIFLLGAGDDSARFKALGHRVMCTCGCNYVLLECNHVGCPLSDGMRAELATAVDSGKDDNAVFQGFVKKYGPAVLLAPPKTGFGRVAWITPYIALLVGVFGVVFVVRVWNKRPPRGPQPPSGGGETSGNLDSYRDQVRKDTEEL